MVFVLAMLITVGIIWFIASRPKKRSVMPPSVQESAAPEPLSSEEEAYANFDDHKLDSPTDAAKKEADSDQAHDKEQKTD